MRALGVSQSALRGHQSINGLRGRKNWGLVGNRGLDQGGMTINSIFLQPRRRARQLELPKALPNIPLAGLQGVLFIRVTRSGKFFR